MPQTEFPLINPKPSRGMGREGQGVEEATERDGEYREV